MSGSEKSSWISWYCTQPGNEFFCEVELEYIADNMTLTGLKKYIPYFKQSHLMLLGTQSVYLHKILSPETSDSIEEGAEVLYGLIHARYILTPQGMAKMLSKYETGDFGYCPRYHCESQPMLPIGLHDAPHREMVQLEKWYCPRCRDIYSPKSHKYHGIDGAYFGTSFAHMLFMMYPQFSPIPKTKFVPRIFGFKIHPLAYQLQKAASEQLILEG